MVLKSYSKISLLPVIFQYCLLEEKTANLNVEKKGERLVLIKSLRNSKRRNKGNFTSKSN